MLATTNDDRLRESLKFAYVSLADWQVDVGPAHQGLDAAKLFRTKPAGDLATDVCTCAEEMRKWWPIVKAEQEALIDELKRLGYW
jgi:hypothetical protein